MLVKYAPQLVKKLGLEYPLLCDQGSRVAAQLGVVYALPEELIEIYRGIGIDLERYNGDKEWTLPLPGRIIIDSAGMVRNVELHADHTDRPEPAETVKILKSL